MQRLKEISRFHFGISLIMWKSSCCSFTVQSLSYKPRTLIVWLHFGSETYQHWHYESLWHSCRYQQKKHVQFHIHEGVTKPLGCIGYSPFTNCRPFMLNAFGILMSPRVDCEHLSEGQTQNLVAPSSKAVTAVEGMPTVCLCSERWHTYMVYRNWLLHR